MVPNITLFPAKLCYLVFHFTQFNQFNQCLSRPRSTTLNLKLFVYNLKPNICKYWCCSICFIPRNSDLVGLVFAFCRLWYDMMNIRKWPRPISCTLSCFLRADNARHHEYCEVILMCFNKKPVYLCLMWRQCNMWSCSLIMVIASLSMLRAPTI